MMTKWTKSAATLSTYCIFILHLNCVCSQSTHNAPSTFGSRNYCIMPHCGVKHIACENDGQLHDNCPADAKLVDMAPHTSFIVTLYNQYRDQIATGKICNFPNAARMATIAWDDELSYLAKLNVMMCDSRRDLCRNCARFKNVGQNIADFSYKGNSNTYTDNDLVKICIDDWLDERKKCAWSRFEKYSIRCMKPIIDHFAMAVTENNTHIGCAAVRFKRDDYHRFHLTCNFASKPQSNHPVYTFTRKSPGIGCKTGLNPEYAGLCSVNEDFDTDEFF